MKLDNYIIKEGYHSKLIYKKDFEEFLSIPNIRTVIELIDQLKNTDIKKSIGTQLVQGDLFVELIGGSKDVTYFKIGYVDKIRFLKDSKQCNTMGYDEILWMQEVKERLEGIDNISIINYKLGYKNNKRSVVISEMILGKNIISLGDFFNEIGILQQNYYPIIGTDIILAIDYFFKGYKTSEWHEQIINIDKNIKIILEKLEDFSDISTNNILINKENNHLYLLDFIKK